MLQRVLNKKIEKYIDDDKILVIEGAHKVGKTTLLSNYEDILSQKEQNKVLFVDVEKEKFSKKLDSANSFLQYLDSHFPASDDEKLYLLLDGIQDLDNPLEFITKLQEERSGAKVITTSSSSKYRKQDLYEEHKENINVFLLYSFSWREYMQVKSGFKLDEPIDINDFDEIKDFYHEYKEDFANNFDPFMQWGSYPDVVGADTTKEKEVAIHNIFHSTISEEVEGKIKEENLETFLVLTRTLAQSVSQELNYSKLSKQLNLHKRTIDKLTLLIRSLFLFSFVDSYYEDPKREISKMMKIYANDMGILNYLVGMFQPERLPVVYRPSHLLNFVFQELTAHEDSEKVDFYRTIAKAEVDFVVETKEGLTPLEVNYSENEEKSSVVMRNFMDRYSEKVEKGIVLTKDKLSENGNELYLPLVMLPYINLN